MSTIINNYTFGVMKEAWKKRTGIQIDLVASKMITEKLINYRGISMKNFLKIIKRKNQIRI